MLKSLFLVLLLLTGASVFAQTPAPPADSLSQYSKDTVGIFTKVDVEAGFPGGITAWKKFLEKNLDAYAPVKDLPANTTNFSQTAICEFIVCKDGTICEIKVINKVLPSIKKEVERVISLSGNWLPAEQNGKKVKAYHRQPVTFFVTAE